MIKHSVQFSPMSLLPKTSHDIAVHVGSSAMKIHYPPIVWNHIVVPPFCVTAGGNLCQCQYEVLAISKRPLDTSNKLLWPQICSMGFVSGLRAGYCMTSTSASTSNLGFSCCGIMIWYTVGWGRLMLMLSDADHTISRTKNLRTKENLKQNHARLQSLIIHWIGWIGIVPLKLSNLLKMYTKFNQYCVRSFTNTDKLFLD